MEKIITKNEQATFDLGKKLGRQCVGGEVFMLVGDLGAGKTKLLQGLAVGLGVKDKVNSPTFNILKVYKIVSRARRLRTFCHIDAYRLNSGADLIALGVEEYFSSPETVTAVEWAEKVRDIWPKRARVVKIKALSEFARQLNIYK
jgi:tRNA threonylcarbamoyladenosine biosynthesis protein TsaE